MIDMSLKTQNRVHIGINMYPKTQNRVHVTLNMYPKTANRVHIQFNTTINRNTIQLFGNSEQLPSFLIVSPFLSLIS